MKTAAKGYTSYISARSSGGRSSMRVRRAAQCSAGGHARTATKLAVQKPRKAEKAPIGASAPTHGAARARQSAYDRARRTPCEDKAKRESKLCGRRAQSAFSKQLAPGYRKTVSLSDGQHAPQEKSGPSSTHRVLPENALSRRERSQKFVKFLQNFADFFVELHRNIKIFKKI